MLRETVLDCSVSPVGSKPSCKVGTEIRPVNLIVTNGHISHIKANVGEAEFNQVQGSDCHSIANNVDKKLSVSADPQVLNIPERIMAPESEIPRRSRGQGSQVNVATSVIQALQIHNHVRDMDVEGKGESDDDDSNIDGILSVAGKHTTLMTAPLTNVQERVKGEVEIVWLECLGVFFRFLLVWTGVTLQSRTVSRSISESL